MKIVKYLVNHPTLMWSLLAAIVIGGVLSFMRMPKLEDPAVPVKQVMMVVARPGASVHEMELQVAQPVEDALRTLPDVKKIKTDVQQGMVMFTVELEMTVLMEDLEQHFDLLRRKANDIQASLPSGCVATMVIDDQMDVYGIFYSLQGEGYDYPELYEYAKLIRRELVAIKGVKRVNIVGDREETVNITLDKAMISQNGILPTQIMLALQDVGKPVDSGLFSVDNQRIAMRVDTMINTVDDVRNLYIPTMDGRRIRLGDVATVERAFKQPHSNGFFVNGQPALAICLALEDDVVVPDLGKEVDAKLAEVMQRLPVGLTTEKIFFQPDKVSEAINSFMVNLVESVLIVILLLVFSMGWRGGVIIGVGLILTICASFPILMQLGTTLQRISLGAFIVAMGMLVDNAIVVMDGILKDRKRGLPMNQWLYRTGRVTAMPLLGATIIAATTFISVFLSPDSTGEYAHDLFLVLAVSLLVSWVLALVQVPFFCKRFLPREEKTKAQRRKGAKESADEDAQIYSGPVYSTMRTAVTWVTGHTKTSLVAALMVLGLALVCMNFVKNRFFPDFEYKQFVVEYQMPPQTSPDQVKTDLLAISDTLMRMPGIERVAASVGGPPARYCLVRPMNNGGTAYGELIIDCPDYNGVMAVIPQVRDYIRNNYPDAYARIRKYNFSIATSHTVEVQFSGPDPEVLRDLSAQAQAIMRDCKYVDAYSVQDNWKPRTASWTFDYDTSDGARSGIKRSDIANALQAATEGMTVGVMSDADKMLMVNLQVRNADGSLITDPAEMPVWNMAGTVATVGSVVRGHHLMSEENAIYRLNGARAIEVECDPDGDNEFATPAKILEDITDKIEAIPLPQGYSMKWVGEQELQNEAMGNLYGYMPLMFFIMIVVLLLLFDRWKRAIVILLCLPFILCGITPALFFTSTPFTFMAIIGMMGLMGMMTKNTIVLVDEADRLMREKGYAVRQAAIEATISRVRPVLLASLTTIVGMIPLIPDPMYGSLAITIMGGLLVGTLITLLLLPLLYVVFISDGDVAKSNPENNDDDENYDNGRRVAGRDSHAGAVADEALAPAMH